MGFPASEARKSRGFPADWTPWTGWMSSQVLSPISSADEPRSDRIRAAVPERDMLAKT